MQKRNGFQTFGFKRGRHHLVIASPNIFVLRICFACLASLPLGVFALNSGCTVPAKKSETPPGRGGARLSEWNPAQLPNSMNKPDWLVVTPVK